MQTFYINKISELIKNKAELEKKLGVKLLITGKKVTIDSEDAINEFEASTVLEAMQFGFSANKALILTEPDIIFRIIHMKDFTRRKNLAEVRARLIGTHGKTRNTLEQVADCEILVSDNAVGLICHAESIDNATTAVSNLIKGSKQANVYRFLERMNAEKKKMSEDLGLKKQKTKE